MKQIILSKHKHETKYLCCYCNREVFLIGKTPVGRRKYENQIYLYCEYCKKHIVVLRNENE